jgi:accessory gene regulator protein AgrB
MFCLDILLLSVSVALNYLACEVYLLGLFIIIIIIIWLYSPNRALTSPLGFRNNNRAGLLVQRPTLRTRPPYL